MTEGQIVAVLRPVVSEIFDKFGSLSRGQVLQMLTTALQDKSSATGLPDELMAMRLAAISTAAGQNTRESAKQRIGRENPYWTPAYEAVCTAVDREMGERERAEALAGGRSETEDRDKRDAARWRKFNEVAKKHWSREQGRIEFYLPRALGGFKSFEETVDEYVDPGTISATVIPQGETPRADAIANMHNGMDAHRAVQQLERELAESERKLDLAAEAYASEHGRGAEMAAQRRAEATPSATLTPKQQLVPIAKNELIVMASEYHRLVKDSRRYEWLRDNMRRLTTAETIRHFIDQPDALSFQETVDEAMRKDEYVNASGKP